MPRVRPLTSGDRMDTYFLSVIEKYMRLAGVRTYGELGPLLGISASTAVRRIHTPQEFQLKEVRMLARRLKIPPEEFVLAFYEGGLKK